MIPGHVLQAGHEICPARVAALEAGIPEAVPAFAVNKACGSGLKAVALAAQAIRAGDAEVVLAGGMENMNRVPYALDRARTGYRMGNAPLVDLLVHGLTCPITKVHMGVTAENVAKRHGISREEQDAYAAASYEQGAEGRRPPASSATRSSRSRFRRRRASRCASSRTRMSGHTPLEALAKLRPAFLKDGTVTAGNASNIDDGAAALLVASERALRAKGWTPIARVVGAPSAGVDPGVMGLGPARAVPRLLAKLGWG